MNQISGFGIVSLEFRLAFLNFQVTSLEFRLAFYRQFWAANYLLTFGYYMNDGIAEAFCGQVSPSIRNKVQEILAPELWVIDTRPRIRRLCRPLRSD